MPTTRQTVLLGRARTPAEATAAPSPVIVIGVLGSASRAGEITRRLLQGADWCRLEFLGDDETAADAELDRIDVAVMIEAGSASTDSGPSRACLDIWIEALSRQGIGQAILTHEPKGRVYEGTVCIPPDCPLERLRGVLTALAQRRFAIRSHARELAGMHRLHQSLHKHFDEIDQELQLASRLQRDFLPRGVSRIGPIRFSTLYRPCTWVSGDIFDIIQLDESHIGFYLADAIGHGVAAGLLTMYIKHAIKPRRISPAGCELVRPSEVMAMLNDQLAAQDLPDAQFITGWYGVIDTRSLRLEYAVAGHPPPMLIDRGELVQELYGEGPMLGLCPGQTYSDESIVLQPGQRVLLFSDGLEPAIVAERRSRPALSILQPEAKSLIAAPSEDLISKLVTQLDAQPGSLNHADDVSLLVIDVEAQNEVADVGENHRPAG